MRIVQTFWAGTKTPSIDKFGWYSPEYHIASWALSCLRLKEFYNEVYLYTDAMGFTIFKETLNLPYTEVYVVYEDLGLHNSLWALPKILTYKRQEVPFIHVDGDVFISSRFSETLEKGQLIAQNREKVTNYYDNIIKDVLNEIQWVPELLNKPLYTGNFNSFNAGIIGGSDTEFFKEMSGLAENIVKKNNNVILPNFNLLFEQILFAELAIYRSKKVVCHFDSIINDDGYSEAQFCNLSLKPNNSNYVHLIGKKKGNLHLCQSLGYLLKRDYPEFYKRIQNYFRNEATKRISGFNIEKKSHIPNDSHVSNLHQSDALPNTNFSDKVDSSSIAAESTLNIPDTNNLYLNEYYVIKRNLDSGFSKVDISFLKSIMTDSIKDDFFFLAKDIKLNLTVVKNRYVHIIEESFNWPHAVKNKINSDLFSIDISENKGLLLIPDMLMLRYTDTGLSDLDYNILKLLDEPMQIRLILPAILETFGEFKAEVSPILFDLINYSLENMSQLNIIYFEET